MKQKKGMGLVEIIIALAIMAAALVPIVGIIHHSFHQIGDEKAEAAVSTFAESVLNEMVFTQPFDAVTDGRSGDELIDGTRIHWVLNVAEVSGLTLAFERVKYHEPCGGGTCVGVDTYGPESPSPAPIDVDKKYGGSVLKTLKLTITWQAYYETEQDPRKTLVLCTRKARLQ